MSRITKSSIDWAWYASGDGEMYDLGPESSREAIIAAGNDFFDGDPFHIIEARKDYIQVADYFDADTFLTELEEGRLSDQCPEERLFSNVNEQHRTELTLKVKETIAEWQRLHDIKIVPWVFTETRNAEDIDPEDANQGELPL